MDKRLEAALEHGKKRRTFNQNLTILKEQVQNHLIYSYNGGNFSITIGLLSFLQINIMQNNNELILLDDRYLPIKFKTQEEILEFYNTIQQRYDEVMENYFDVYEDICSSNNIEDIIKIFDNEEQDI